MKHILVYADSLSWGIIPMTRNRLPFHERWPGVLETILHAKNRNYRVIEDCLNGRRTTYEDPIKPGRNGLIGLAQRIEIHSPLSLVILMLGTNDFQFNHHHTAQHAAAGIKQLINAIREAPIEPGMPIPKILVIAPPSIQIAKGEIAEKFKNAEYKCIGLAEAYQATCKEMNCDFFNAELVTSASLVDGVHLDKDQHLLLGKAIANYLLKAI